MSLDHWLTALPAMLGVALLAWAVASIRHNAGLVDIFWSLMILAASLVWLALPPATGARGLLVLALTWLWGLRLAVYLAARNWNAPEDHRYVAIRARHEPGYTWKSLYLVFGLQALLAWVVALPVGAAVLGSAAPLWTDGLGGLLALFGLGYESIADAQLSRFKSDVANRRAIMDRGLWRYSRHPNYFGEFCFWWGMYLIAFATGDWWTIVSPLLMSVLLLRVSGVTLLERDIGERRPEYRDYVQRTPAFFPAWHRSH